MIVVFDFIFHWRWNVLLLYGEVSLYNFLTHHINALLYEFRDLSILEGDSLRGGSVLIIIKKQQFTDEKN
jgi:hypothetical protein